MNENVARDWNASFLVLATMAHKTNGGLSSQFLKENERFKAFKNPWRHHPFSLSFPVD
jgi:hypothetical protein